MPKLLVANRGEIAIRIIDAAEAMGVPADRLATVHQVHSADVVTLKAGDDPAGVASRRADALVTDAPGIAIAVLTADCQPVLLADSDAGVIGAAHAGWRGALDGVLESTVEAMRALGARDIRAAPADTATTRPPRPTRI